jgi:hypothetical protein
VGNRSGKKLMSRTPATAVRAQSLSEPSTINHQPSTSINHQATSSTKDRRLAAITFDYFNGSNGQRLRQTARRLAKINQQMQQGITLAQFVSC